VGKSGSATHEYALAVCKRCLLSDLAGTDHAAHIYEYIASIPDEIKAGAAEVHERLSLCRACDNLVNGMCRLCGCYVEVRAAKKGQVCPHPAPLW